MLAYSTQWRRNENNIAGQGVLERLSQGEVHEGETVSHCPLA